VEAEIAWSITATSAKVPEGDRLESVQGIGRKSAGCDGVASWGWALEIRAGLVSVRSLHHRGLKEGLEPQVREVRPPKAPEALGWVRLSLAEATTTKCVYGTSVDLVVPRPSRLLFILLGLDLEVASALHIVHGQIVVATAMAMFPCGSSTNTLQRSRHSLGILTLPEYWRRVVEHRTNTFDSGIRLLARC
jgi:hypothetical protein